MFTRISAEPHNTLYPALRRFENMGTIIKQIHKQVGKPKRNMYDITETGEEIFYEMLREFPEKIATNNAEFLVRIALFEKLDYEARKEILTIRQAALHKQLTAIQSLHVSSFFITEVIEFSKLRIEHELLWITSLMKKI
ncbi:PadR family transcriptional regulator [Bacillus albus]|uniref:PadR family transcriptional regulator n=1 Tax=Bacillus cereus group TaxID=86661 RepID=UPI0022E1DC9E|nr:MULTISPECIES: PadR family transcriptional regulator [Bacillus cereus group]MDA2025927.1 PadR family transcriptional regulator [Bacillus cereus group sp. Bcc03]MDA2215705.1 PadR family transcriptional regulator [Bacillus cereus group sp. Bc228]MDA2225919.1 PadR family transcriptional regulator [Bacillus cereus group sp. Bc227]MDA2260031.1 PadR family transcriptional regulator [Bacillus cereus group sp. Bc200]MDA2320321.1 PadR family transcriptional regulator [Bacillus cereus group sp. Bc177]